MCAAGQHVSGSLLHVVSLKYTLLKASKRTHHHMKKSITIAFIVAALLILGGFAAYQYLPSGADTSGDLANEEASPPGEEPNGMTSQDTEQEDGTDSELNYFGVTPVSADDISAADRMRVLAPPADDADEAVLNAFLETVRALAVTLEGPMDIAGCMADPFVAHALPGEGITLTNSGDQDHILNVNLTNTAREMPLAPGASISIQFTEEETGPRVVRCDSAEEPIGLIFISE